MLRLVATFCLCLFLFLLGFNSSAADLNTKRIVLCLWVKSIETNSPAFALYDDGSVIYARRPHSQVEGKPTEYCTAKLSQNKVIKLHALIPPLDRLQRQYEATKLLHGNYNYIFARTNNHMRCIQVYGDLYQRDKLGAPIPFLNAFEELSTFQATNAKPWRATEVELELADALPTSSATEWPKDLGMPVKSLLRLSNCQFKRLEQLAPSTVFRYGDQYWRIAGHRDVFPDEDSMMDTFEKALPNSQ